MEIERARRILCLSLVSLSILLVPSLGNPRADDSSDSSATDRISSGLKEVATGLQTLDESLARRATHDLISAAASGNLSATRALLAKGVDPNSKDSTDRTALEAAALIGQTEIARLLIERGADVNAKGILGITPLMCAAEKGYAATVHALISAGADVNAVSETGRTALMAAERNKQTAVVDLLKKAGAVGSVQPPQPQGSVKVPRNRSELQEMIASSDSPSDLIVASLSGDAARVSLLLNRGADVKAKGSFGMTALMHAAQNGYAEVAKVLIAGGADPNAANDFGMTPLMFAAKGGHAEVIKLLIDSGADLNAQEQIAHQTALMLAERAGHPEVVELLEQAGAKE